MEWQDKVRETAEKSAQVPQIQPGDVPDIELYMDQLVTFLDQRLGAGKRENNAPFVTGTMVNNYTKARLIPPAEHKRYHRRHVLGLSLVGQLKKVLSMQDLGKISGAVQDSVFEDSLYKLFLETQRQAFDSAPELVEQAAKKSQEQHLTDNGALAAMAVQLAAQAQCRTLLAERLLDLMEPPKTEESRKKTKA